MHVSQARSFDVDIIPETLGKASRKKSPELSGIFPKRGGGGPKEDHFPYFFLKTA